MPLPNFFKLGLLYAVYPKITSSIISNATWMELPSPHTAKKNLLSIALSLAQEERTDVGNDLGNNTSYLRFCDPTMPNVAAVLSALKV